MPTIRTMLLIFAVWLILCALVLSCGCAFLPVNPKAGVEARMQYQASREALRGEYGPARGAWDLYRGK